MTTNVQNEGHETWANKLSELTNAVGEHLQTVLTSALYASYFALPNDPKGRSQGFDEMHW